MTNNTKYPTSAEAKRAYAKELEVSLAKKGIFNPVIVLPTVIGDEKTGFTIDDTKCATPSEKSTKGFGFIGLYQTRTVYQEGVQYDNEVWCIQRGKVDSLERMYTVGQVLEGHIVIKDTMTPPNEDDFEQDLKFISAECREAVQPCTIGGKKIYQKKYWDITGETKDTTIAHDNDKELRAFTDKVRASNAKPQSAGIKAAGRKNARTI